MIIILYNNDFTRSTTCQLPCKHHADMSPFVAFRHTRHTSRFMETTKDLTAHLTSPWAPSCVKTSEVFISGFSKTQKKGLQMSKKYQKVSKFVKVQQLSKFSPWTISFNQQSIGSIQTSVRWHSAKPTSDRLSRCFHPSCQEDPMKSTFRAKGRMYSRCSWQRRKRRKAKVIPTRYSKEFFVGKTCLWYDMVIPCCIFKLSHVPHKSLTSFNVSNAPRSPCPAPLHQWSRKVLHWHRPDNLLANRPYHRRAAFSGPVSREDGFFRTHRIHGPGVFTWYLLTFALNLWKM